MTAILRGMARRAGIPRTRAGRPQRTEHARNLAACLAEIEAPSLFYDVPVVMPPTRGSADAHTPQCCAARSATTSVSAPVSMS